MPIEYIQEPIKAIITTRAGPAIGALYTNNTMRPLQVVIVMTHRVTVAGSFLLGQLQINGIGRAWGGWFNTPAVGIELYSTLVGMVPPAGTMQLLENAAGGVNTIILWSEVEM